MSGIMRSNIIAVVILLMHFNCVLSIIARSPVFTSDKHNKVVYSSDDNPVNRGNVTATELLKKTYTWISWFKIHQKDFRGYAQKDKFSVRGLR